MIREDEIAELLKTPEGRKILDAMLNESPVEQLSEVPPEPALESIDASPYGNAGGVDPADLPPEFIGASPVNPGATRGLPPEGSGVDPEEQNRRLGSETFPLIEDLGIGARGQDTPAEREFLNNLTSGVDVGESQRRREEMMRRLTGTGR